MASGSALIALLDDIATMVKITSAKTGSVFNAKKAKPKPTFDFSAVYTIAKGSVKNKAFIIPSIIAINAAAPWAIIPMLSVGGVYFCYEGIKKINHRNKAKDSVNAAIKDPKKCDALQKRKIKHALQTDFVLSSEIMALTMLTVVASPLLIQFGVLSAVGAVATVGVYGVVAGIVNMAAFGERLKSKKGDNLIARTTRSLGKRIISAKPKLMQTISVLGTASMFIVGGTLLLHGIPGAEPMLNSFAQAVSSTSAVQSIIEVSTLVAGAVGTGLAATGIKYSTVLGFKKIKSFSQRKLPILFNRKVSKQMLSAIENGDTMGAKKLLRQGASLNIRNQNGETPLMRATWAGDKRLVNAFLKAGAKPNKKSPSGSTALGHAIDNEHTDIVAILVKHGAKEAKKKSNTL